jgi:hypothetical protein
VAGGYTIDGGNSYVLTDAAGVIIEQDDLGQLWAFASAGGAGGSGLIIPPDQSITYSATPFAGDGSFQPIGPDLNLDADAGVDDPDTAYLAPIMGNVIGDSLTKDADTVAGLIGKLSVTGTRASTYPVAAVVGEVGDGVTEADGAFVAVIGGDSAQTNAQAAFSVDNQNSTPGSGLNYVVDGYKASHNGYPAFVPLLGFARIGHNTDGDISLFFGQATDDASIVAQVGSDSLWADGSLYISAVAGAGKLFQKQNDVWIDLQA